MEKFIPVEDAVLRDTFWNAAIDLKKENDELKQRIKRLEEAGDAIVKKAERVGVWPMELQMWRKAKEVQP